MKIHINSLNNIFLKFFEENMLAPYEEMWRKNGDSEITINMKVFGYIIGAKLLLQGDIVSKFPFLKTLTDSDGYIELDNVKKVVIETFQDFKSKNKKLIIPKLDWNLDENDINTLFNYANAYTIKETINETSN